MTPGTWLIVYTVVAVYTSIVHGQTTAAPAANATTIPSVNETTAAAPVETTAAPAGTTVATVETTASPGVSETTVSTPDAGSNSTSTIPDLSDADYVWDRNCSTKADCPKNAECNFVTLADGTSRGLRCLCNVNNGWKKDAGGDTCQYQAKLGESCEDPISVCIDENAECRTDGSLAMKNRCQCKVGFITIKTEAGTMCGRIIHTGLVAGCATCEENDGTCYSITSANERSGCLCPASRTGFDCQTIHVNVTCDVNTFQMRVCYLPHPGVNFTTGSMMYTVGKGSDEACKGTQVQSNATTTCPVGQYELVLPLAKAELDRCGTREYLSEITVRKFESKIVVQKDAVQSGTDDIIFDVFCSFQTHIDAAFAGVGVNAIPGNDRGEHKEAKVTLQVFDHLNIELDPNAPIFLADKIRFAINLVADGTYSALRVERCTASSSPSIPDPKAVTKRLFMDGCPWSGQKIFNSSNNWRLTSGQNNAVETGLFYMFRMSKGKTVHIHCTLKLCLAGDEASCALPTCSAGRRKRDIASGNPTDEDLTLGGTFVDSPANTDDETDVTTSLYWYNEESLKEAQKQQGLVSMEQAGFAVLILVLVALLIIFVVLSVYFFSRSRRQPAKEVDLGFNKPQRFALPRIGRTNQRV